MNFEFTADEIHLIARLLSAEDQKLRARRPDLIPYGTWDDRMTARVTKRMERASHALWQAEWKARQARWEAQRKAAQKRDAAKKKAAAKKK